MEGIAKMRVGDPQGAPKIDEKSHRKRDAKTKRKIIPKCSPNKLFWEPKWIQNGFKNQFKNGVNFELCFQCPQKRPAAPPRAPGHQNDAQMAPKKSAAGSVAWRVWPRGRPRGARRQLHRILGAFSRCSGVHKTPNVPWTQQLAIGAGGS